MAFFLIYVYVKSSYRYSIKDTIDHRYITSLVNADT